jgi:integrase
VLAELDAVTASLSPRYAAMVIFAAATGLRPAEWLALEWRDIDLEARVVYLHRSFMKGRLKCPKTEASRAVPVADDCTRSARAAASGSAGRTLVPR